MTKDQLLERMKTLLPIISAEDLDLLPDNFPANRYKLNLVCAKHGPFKRAASELFRSGREGCPQCNRLKGKAIQGLALLETFKIEAPKKFNNRFTYDYTTFKGHREPMRMICPDHGEFWAEPSRHLHTKEAGGCKQCGNLLRAARRGRPDDEWFALATKIHGSKYEYLNISPLKSVSGENKRIITYVCLEHGEQTQGLENHLYAKKGCIKCAHNKIAENYLRDPADVVRELENLFPGRLGFEKFNYEGGVTLFTLVCKEHEVEFKTNMTNIRTHPSFYSCPKCAPRCDSSAQRGIYNAVKTLRLKAKYNDRKILAGKEIDILIPDLNLGIEYNGVYWHSEKWLTRVRDAKWHMVEKQQLATGKGVELVHFDSTIPSEKIINFIKFKAGKVARIFARKTVSAQVEQSTAEAMLDELHIQGAAKGCTSYGLFQNKELLGVASFSRATSERGNKDPHRWELRRMVFNCQVIGGASKLLKAFTREHPEVRSLISYSDNRWFTGGVYNALGFEHTKDCPLDYAYTKGDSIWHKAQFKHSAMKTKPNFVYDENLSEIQNCHNNGYFRIWDCGKKKWELTL